MQSVIVNRFGGPEVLQLSDVPERGPGPGQVRIRVAASAVNPIDLSTRAGRLVEAGLMSGDPPVGMGWDVAGHVDAAGSGVHRFLPEDPVIGLRTVLSAPGAHAESAVLDIEAIAPAPRSVPLVDAGAFPLNALTADRALALTRAIRGQTVLVTGAAGGIGGYVLELAAMRGIRTVALAPALRRSAGARPRCRCAPCSPPPVRGTAVVVQEVAADGARLAELAALVDFGLLTIGPVHGFPLDRAPDAHRLVEAGGLRQRVVLHPGSRG